MRTSGVTYASKNTGSYDIKQLAVIDLPANGYTAWDADFSTVTDSLSAPAGVTTFDCDADCHIRETFTAEDGKVVRLWFRYTDTDNYIELVVSGATPSSMALNKRVLASTTGLETDLGVLTDGVEYQIDVIANDSSIKVFVDNVSQMDVTESDLSGDSGGRMSDNLATDDLVLTSHPNPALGIATDRVIAPQETDTATHRADCLVYGRTVTLPIAGILQYDFRGAA
jgi:hypothetical protein